MLKNQNKNTYCNRNVQELFDDEGAQSWLESHAHGGWGFKKKFGVAHIEFR